MSRKCFQRWFAAIISPVVCFGFAGGTTHAGQRACDSACPQVIADSYQTAPIPIQSELESISDSIVAPQPAREFDPSSAFATNFGGGGSGSFPFGAPRTNGGYIDTAIVRTQARFRFDAAYDFDRADRAEFFYSTWQSFGGKNPNPPVGFPDPDVDRQSISLYYEHAFGRDEDVSLFVDLPIIFSDPLYNPNDQGIGDLLVGLKLSLRETRCSQLTFQLKNYIPTAKASELWLGTGHYSIEPGLLYLSRLGKRWTLETEIRDWIPIGGAKNPLNNGKDYAGNVLRYGAGLGYELCCVDGNTITPVVECVGWSVLGGQVFEFNDSQVDPNVPGTGTIGPRSASGDTIVNIKLGTRIANACGGSVYAGWGHSLTGDRWYRDIFRLELRKMF